MAYGKKRKGTSEQSAKRLRKEADRLFEKAGSKSDVGTGATALKIRKRYGAGTRTAQMLESEIRGAKSRKKKKKK